MIMVQKPAHILSSPASHHRRMPSAPPTVLVQPTRTPGLLSLSKPAPQPRAQSRQAGARPRAPHTKPNKAVKGSPDVVSAQVPSSADKPGQEDVVGKATSSPSEKSNRGRQNGKQTKEKNVPRSTSPNSTRINNRRHPHPHHQGSPPLPSQIPSQAEVHTSNRPAFARSHSHAPRARNANANPFDPFLVSDSENSAPEAPNAASNGPNKSPQSKGTPKLSSRPSGKLARRRQGGPDVSGTPTPPPSKSVPVPRGGGKRSREPKGALTLSRSDPAPSAMPARSGLTQSSSAGFGGFPVCDDFSDDDDVPSPPATPTKEKSGATWQQALFDDGPRTAPLASTFAGSPFFPGTASTPSPDRKRQHLRSPSEGVFDMSMDEGSMSTSDQAEAIKFALGISNGRKRLSSHASTPVGISKSVNKPGFFASSNFQNSPSPDDLPPPAFGF